MIDVQNEKPGFEYPINMVGIRKLMYPIRVLDRQNGHQLTVAEISMFVDLPKNFRGTHMSRFVEILNKFRCQMTYEEVRLILIDMKESFDAESAHIYLDFPYFIEKSAPITNSKGLLEYKAFFRASLDGGFTFELGVMVPITTLCPCSKEISERGAHNQRAIVKICIKFNEFVWIEELIECAESSASAQVYPILKRPDEKFVTEMAYDNPRFVEDIVREVAKKLLGDKRILSFKVEAESAESIHNHNAYAMIERTIAR